MPRPCPRPCPRICMKICAMPHVEGSIYPSRQALSMLLPLRPHASLLFSAMMLRLAEDLSQIIKGNAASN